MDYEIEMPEIPNSQIERTLRRWTSWWHGRGGPTKKPRHVASRHSPGCPCLSCAQVRVLLGLLPVTPDLACYVLDPERARPYQPFGDTDAERSAVE